jgi:hypothetical protein
MNNDQKMMNSTGRINDKNNNQNSMNRNSRLNLTNNQNSMRSVRRIRRDANRLQFSVFGLFIVALVIAYVITG